MDEVKVLPKSRLGIWSIMLIILMPILLFVGRTTFLNFYANIPAGKTIPQDMVIRPGIALPMLSGIFSGIAAFVTGMLAIWKKEERALLIYISSFMGLLVCLFVLGEMIFPH